MRTVRVLAAAGSTAAMALVLLAGPSAPLAAVPAAAAARAPAHSDVCGAPSAGGRCTSDRSAARSAVSAAHVDSADAYGDDSPFDNLKGGQTTFPCEKGFTLCTGLGSWNQSVGSVNQPPATVAGVTPASGTDAGGVSVTITGTDFTAVTEVKFGATPATDVVRQSTTTITATTPAHVAGLVGVTVDTTHGTAAKATAFTFTSTTPPATSPTITTVSPVTGAITGGTAVTVTGTNLTGTSSVRFGDTPATSVTVESATTVTATTPAHPSGIVALSVATTHGTASAATAFSYFIPPPTINHISPTQARPTGGTSVTISGTFLTGTISVKFGTTPATDLVVTGSTSVSVTTPRHGSGVVSVSVSTIHGTATDSNAFDFYGPPPTVSRLTPTSGPSSGGTTVTITGTNFTSTTFVEFGTTFATAISVESSTTLTATTPAGSPGAVNVSVFNQFGTTTVINAFTYTGIAPNIISLTPTSGTIGGGTRVSIAGTNITGVTRVKFGTTAATSITVKSTTQIIATTPPHPAGEVSVTVVTTHGSQTKPTAFHFGTSAPLQPACSSTAVGSPSLPGGYWLAGADGAVYSCGDAPFYGSLVLKGINPVNPIVGIAATPDHQGYWLVASDGGLFAFGDAQFYGSMGGKHLNRPVVGMTATPQGGYFEVASDGGLFAFGPGATFHGSMGGKPLNRPVVGMAETAQGGYFEVASDGGLFAFGPGATFRGSMGGKPLNRPVVGLSVASSGGYYEVASDGGIFAFGAPFHGSTGCLTLSQPIVAMIESANTTSTGTGTACGFNAPQAPGGYQFVAGDGGVFSFGNGQFVGSLGGDGVTDIVGMANG